MDSTKAMEQWLERRWMGRCVNTLLENGFTSLADVKRCSDHSTIIQLFDKPGHRLKMRLLLEEDLPLIEIAEEKTQTESKAAPAEVSAALASSTKTTPATATTTSTPTATTTAAATTTSPKAVAASSATSDVTSAATSAVATDRQPTIGSGYESGSESSSSDSEDDLLPPPTTSLPPLPGTGTATGGGDSSDSDDGRSGGKREASDIARRKQALMSKFQGGAAGGTSPVAGSGSAGRGGMGGPGRVQSAEFKNKLAGLGAVLQGGAGFGGMATHPKLTKGKQYVAPATVATSGPEDSGYQSDDEKTDANGLPPTSSLSDPDKEGYMDKQGKMKQWQRRLCILKGKNLYWLRSADDKYPAGTIDFTERGVTFTEGSGGTIEVINSKKTYVFRAPSPAEHSAWFLALQKASGKEVEPVRSPAKDVSPDEQAKIDRLMEILQLGAMFIKYKHKKGKDRMIWCPPSLDRIYWGDRNKKKTKGFMLVSDIQRVSEGCFGSKRNECAFTVLSTERTLELEATSIQEKEEWMRAIQYLIGK